MRHNQSQDYLKSLPYYDLVITNKSYIKEDLKRLGAKNVIFVNNTFDDLFHYPRKLSLTEKKEFICDVGFIGAWEKERCESILFLAKNNINVRVYGDKSWEKYINMYPTLDIRIGGLYSDNYVKALQSFKISLCFLRKMNFDQQTTRSVEIPACGGFLMAERTNEHLSLFEENKEAVYFSSNKELLEKCKFYLKNDTERKQIIENGHKRCIQSGYSNIDTIYKILKNMYINNANYFDTIKNFIRKILAIISIIHLSVFFNIETILGISVTWISTELYLRFILKRSNVILRPFSFIAISFLFLFMYFAPIVTLIDFNPIYNNMSFTINNISTSINIIFHFNFIILSIQ